MLRLVVTNISGQPCVRDLDAARQEIVVWSGDGSHRLWSSNDCLEQPRRPTCARSCPASPSRSPLHVGRAHLDPGLPAAADGRCRRARTALMVRLDDLISPPTPFLRTP